MTTNLLQVMLHSSEANVGEIFAPFKIGNRDTAGVQVNIRDNQNTALEQNFIGCRRYGTVGGFRHDLGTDFPDVL